MQPKFNSIIFLVLGLIAGIAGTIFFNTNNTAGQFNARSMASPADMKMESVVVETHYQGKLDSLQQTNVVLSRKVTGTKSELQRAKLDNKVLLELVDTLLVHAGSTTDTAQKLADCDTLQSAVRELITTNNQKDSLYEDLAVSLQYQVSNKDSVIGMQQQEYNALKLFFDKSLTQQEVLSGQNMLYEKQIKRHKIKSKLLSAGVFILTGIATYGLLHH
jgi:hypothetical protein